jgi:hypothetical protein
MRIFRQFGVLVLLLVSCLAPAMACMVPNAEMSTQERACCRMMKNQCGQMGMPVSHGCCQKTPPSVHDNALNTKAVTFQPILVLVGCCRAGESDPDRHRMGRTRRLLTSKIPAFDHFRHKNLVSSSLARHLC